MRISIFDIDFNDDRLPNANIKGEGFIMLRGFLEGVKDARSEYDRCLKTTRLKSGFARYKLADKKRKNNRYYRIMNGIHALFMYEGYMEHNRKLHVDLLEDWIENGLFHVDFEDTVTEMILQCNNLKWPPKKKLFYKTKRRKTQK